ncbi:molecular chaperone Hsp33 [Thermosyntropha lipolytica DSM 11003]|uniref:33 kDa chaperonin n=1 Tax=Thermosyntropha lipolytica DSM 11003 TaxID=1123382 RepID=A0A1M5P4P2_9FIRM|nr:Hsp33 family molecular chaperone HslO [Thermosyntropha lipolytica]SHG96791.1 molecular chaperone Hsp33 [Thermosyntropha lipolytica DSM 11003]
MNRDYLLRAADAGKNVRIFLAHTTGAVEEMRRRHNTSATASAATGRLLTAAFLMGADLKGKEDSLTLKIAGDGPVGSIIATADAEGGARAYPLNPEADVPPRYPGKLDVGTLIGNGYLEVIKDLGLKQPFVGRVELVSGEIAEDLAYYFMKSEQIPSLVSLGVLVDRDLRIRRAGGLLLQAMPEADDKILAKIEGNVMQMGPISGVMENKESLEDILAEIMGDIKYEILERRDLTFRCKCSRERLKSILAGFAEEEIRDIYEKEGKLELRCNFCNEVYVYDLDEIYAEKSRKP